MKTRLINIKASVLLVIYGFILTACASTETLYAEYEHQCRVSIISNATGTVVVDDSTGDTLLWEPAVYFNYDKDDLLEIELARLKTNIAVLNAYPELKIDVRGFTDSIATEGYNVALAGRRAATVMDYLKEQGIAESRVFRAPLGESLPLADNDTYENRAMNRRVELLLLDSNGRPAPIRLVDKSKNWDAPSNVSSPGTEKDWRR